MYLTISTLLHDSERWKEKGKKVGGIESWTSIMSASGKWRMFEEWIWVGSEGHEDRGLKGTLQEPEDKGHNIKFGTIGKFEKGN